MASKKFWDTLSSDEQKVLKESCTVTRDFERRFNREQDPKLLADLKAKGMVHTELAPGERARLREALKPVYDKYNKTLGEDVVRQTLAELEKVRAAGR